MADNSPLADLLDRAGDVFSTALRLSFEFQESRQQSNRDVIRADPNRNWEHYRPQIDQMCSAIAKLREPIQSPPSGFESVAKALREVGSAARRAISVMKTEQGQAFQSFADLFPDLYTPAVAGYESLRESRQSIKAADPLAFVDEPPEPKPMQQNEANLVATNGPPVIADTSGARIAMLNDLEYIASIVEGIHKVICALADFEHADTSPDDDRSPVMVAVRVYRDAASRLRNLITMRLVELARRYCVPEPETYGCSVSPQVAQRLS